MSEQLTLEVSTVVYGMGRGPRALPVFVVLHEREITARTLIADHVRAELARAQHARETSLALHYLLATDLRAAPAHADPLPAAEHEVARAQQALAEGRFMLVVDGRAVRGLDEPLLLTERSQVGFVRLLQLVGG